MNTEKLPMTDILSIFDYEKVYSDQELLEKLKHDLQSALRRCREFEKKIQVEKPRCVWSFTKKYWSHIFTILDTSTGINLAVTLPAWCKLYQTNQYNNFLWDYEKKSILYSTHPTHQYDTTYIRKILHEIGHSREQQSYMEVILSFLLPSPKQTEKHEIKSESWSEVWAREFCMKTYDQCIDIWIHTDISKSELREYGQLNLDTYRISNFYNYYRELQADKKTLNKLLHERFRL